MNTNSGTAARTKLDAMSSIFSITWKITAPLKTPSHHTPRRTVLPTGMVWL